MPLRPEILDRTADVLRRAHLHRNGTPPTQVLPWRSLQPSEQQRWRDLASTARPAQ